MSCKKVSKYDVEPIKDPCGLLRELYSSPNLSIAHDTVTGEARKHMHRTMEEVYYVTRGRGQLVLGEDLLEIKEGDLIPLPKNIPHALKRIEGVELEVLVINHPKYNPNDVIFAE